MRMTMLRFPFPVRRLTELLWPAPARIPALDVNDIHVWKCNVGHLAELDTAMRTSLDECELARAGRFLNAADRARFVLSHGLLRALAAHYLDRQPAALVIATGEFGKPHLAGPEQGNLSFNLSHSGDLLTLAFARSGRLGVDVERWSPTLAESERARICRSVFSASEQRGIAQLPAEERQAAFYSVWTRKEAYIKATGFGLSRGLDYFEVSVHPQSACLRSDSSLAAGVAEWRIIDLPPEAGYSAALATDIDKPHVMTMTIGATLKSDASSLLAARLF